MKRNGESRIKLRQLTAALGLVAGLAVGTVAQAGPAPLIIDDWNLDAGTSAQVSDSVVGGVVIAPRTSTGGTSLTRANFMANLTSGDRVSTIDCANCQQGHFVNDANSRGAGYWGWTAANLDFSSYTDIMIDYDADVGGADMIVSLVDNGVRVGEVWWKDLVATDLNDLDINGDPIMVSLTKGISWFGSNRTVDQIYLDVFSVGGNYTDPTGLLGTRDFGAGATSLDLNVDNLKVIPEPASLALAGMALLGLAASRRRVS